MKVKKYSNAMNDLTRAERSSSLKGFKLVECCLNICVCYRMKKQVEEGLDFVIKAIKITIMNKEEGKDFYEDISERCLVERGRCYFELKMYDLCENDFDKVLEINKSNYWSLFYKGLLNNLNIHKGNSDYIDKCRKSVEYFTLALKSIKQKNANLQISDFHDMIKSLQSKRGFCYFELKDYKNAILDFNKVIERHEKTKFLRRKKKFLASIYRRIGLCYLRIGYYQKAKEEFLKVMKLRRLNHLILYNTYVVSKKMRDYSASIAYITKAFELGPSIHKRKYRRKRRKVYGNFKNQILYDDNSFDMDKLSDDFNRTQWNY